MNAKLAIDSLVLFAYFAIIIFIGLRMGRKEDDLEDFALGGRRIPWWAVLASIIAAETTAATFFGAPGEGPRARGTIRWASPVIDTGSRFWFSPHSVG